MGVQGKSIFRASSVYINNLSLAKAMSRHHSGGQNPRDAVREIPHWLAGVMCLPRHPPGTAARPWASGRPRRFAFRSALGHLVYPMYLLG